MRYLWLLIPFLGMWLAAYILSIILLAIEWWTIPLIITMFIVWAASFVYAGDKVGAKN